VKNSPRPIRPIFFFSFALVWGESGGCYSIIWKQYARGRCVEQNDVWCPGSFACKGEGSKRTLFLNCIICEKCVLEGKAVNIESSIIYESYVYAFILATVYIERFMTRF
jgi:hypothetical protein